MGDNPFQPSGTLAFLTGLTGSTMDYFKQQHDRKQKEDDYKKQVDYDLLMRALDQMKPNLTPSQAREILSRASDIYKPQGATNIKDRLAEVFGGGPAYQMHAGDIIKEATSRPRLQVGTENAPTDDTEPSVFPGGVTLPAPPGPERPVYEKTYGEQELADKEALINAQTEKQLATEERRAALRQEYRDKQNQAILQRFKEEQDIKDDATATKKLRERASYFGDPDDPNNQERARQSLQQELKQKLDYGQSRVDYNRKRLSQIDESISITRQRMNVALQKAGATKAADFNKDPQVKGAWAKVSEYSNVAKSMRTQAATRYAKGDTEGGAMLDKEAEKAELQVQSIIDNIDQRINNYLIPRAGGVNLPNPPRKSGAVGRGGVKLTESEIRSRGQAAGRSEQQIQADIEYARSKGVLAQ